MARWKAMTVAALFGPMMLAGRSLAQDQPDTTEAERQSVLQQPRPDYDPLGLRLGSFLLYPSVDLSETYDSNVYYTQSGAIGDIYTTVRPSVQLRSDWNNNALNFTAVDETKRYASQVSENYSNELFSTDGRLDIERNVYLDGQLSYQLQHIDRFSPNSLINQVTPTTYQVGSGHIGFVHEAGRLGLRLDGNIDYYTYNNEATITGVPIPETPMNRIEYSTGPRLEYEIIPGYQAFVQSRVNWREYMSQFDAPPPTGFDRTSHGYKIDAGTAIRLGAKLNGEVFVGYFQQNYNDPRLVPVTGPDFGGSLLWNVSAVTSVRASVARTIEETIFFTAESFLQTASSISIEHELRRNLLVNAGASYTVQDFQGTVLNFYNYEAHVGGRYLLNRNLAAVTTVSWLNRIADQSINNFNAVTVSIGLRTQF